LNRYIGFINDLREGTRVSVEGRVFGNTILPAKVTIGGRSYNFLSNNLSLGPGVPGFDRRQGNGQGRGSCCR